MKKIIFIITLLSLNYTLQSQNDLRDFKRLSLDIDFGIPIFYGDIKTKAGTAYSLKLNYHLTSAFSLFGDLSFVNLKAGDKVRLNSFNNNSLRFLVGGEVYLFNILRLNKITKIIQPFGGVGVGFIKNGFSKSILEDTEVELKDDNYHFIHQYTGGLKLKITKAIDWNLKVKINYTKTDMLDNYKPNVIANKNNDAFVTFATGVTFHLGKKSKDPIIWNNTENYLFFLSKNTSYENTNNSETVTNKNSEPKTSTEEPIYNNPNKDKYQDADENEFDCIIKF